MARELISLVICSRNRASMLANCLAAIRAMAMPDPCEVVVVDNGSRDSTRDVVMQYANEVSFPVRYVFEETPGLGHARNTGVAAASGDRIVFTDDDCYPASDFLVESASVFRDSRIAYYGGRVLLHNPDDYPLTIKTSTSQVLLPPHARVAAGFIHGANMGVRRCVFEAIGGFDESLGAGTPLACAEDFEFIARASAEGYWGGYFPGPVVRHDHGRKKQDADRLMEGYDLGRGACYAAMSLRPNVRSLYVKYWVATLSWKRRAAIARELRGGALFALTAAGARIKGRSFVPRFPPSNVNVG